MTSAEFRRLAVGIPGAVEGRHQDHPDFRIGGKVFATLGYPDAEWGMVNLEPADQADLIKTNPSAFRPAAGAWGRKGSTLVELERLKARELKPALASAAARAAAKTSRQRPQTGSIGRGSTARLKVGRSPPA